MVAPSSAVASTGGQQVPDNPRVERISCVATKRAACPGAGAVARGALVRVTGRQLDATTVVVFAGGRGRRDDVRVRPRHLDADHVEATVPARARTGRLVVVNRLGRRSMAPRRLRVQEPPSLDDAPGDRFFYAGRSKPTFEFQVAQPGEVAVELVDEATGAALRSWAVSAQPGTPARIRWDGETADGAPAPAGRYRFRLAGDGASAAPAAGSDVSFALYDHLFPIRGRHDLGQTPTNDFGGERDHKGQDMFARCGTRLAAARGGRVKYAGYHGAAGNYVVIDGAGTDRDYVYMHMRSAPLVRTGQRVFTGQRLGEVGDTGNASGCHLHFELWSAPGWYAGGTPVDPLPELRIWDAYS